MWWIDCPPIETEGSDLPLRDLVDRPIAITWRVAYSMPAALFDAYATLVSRYVQVSTNGGTCLVEW